MSRYGIQALSLNGSLVAGFSGETMTRGRDVNTDQTDGVVFETAQHILKVAPTGEFTNMNLKAVLALLGTSGTIIYPLLTLDGSSGAQMVLAKAATGGSYASGSVHQALTALNGLVYLAGVRWSPGQKAAFTLRGMFISTDGVTDPLTPSAVGLPTQQVPNNGWTVAGLVINGATVVTINSLELSIDPKLEFEYSTGLPMPVDLTGAGARGALAIRLQADIGDVSVADGTGSVSVLLKRYAIGGGFTSDSITFTLSGNYSFEDARSGTAPSPAGKTITVIPTYNGTTFPLTWSTT